MRPIILNWIKTYKVHILIWSIFISYEVVLVGLFAGAFGKPLTYLVHYAIILLLFYVNAHVFLVWALKNRRNVPWRLPFILIVQMGAYILISYSADVLLFKGNFLAHAKTFSLTSAYCLASVYRCLYFLGFSMGYYFLITFLKERKRTEDLEKQRLYDIISRQRIEQELSKAQPAFLKAQISPHFLFNTLDFIYHSINLLSPIAADAIISLSEMMRYAIDADKWGEFISVREEITQVENLLYLYRVRKGHEACIKVNCTDEAGNLELIPLVLLTLIENIFKHGNLSNPTHEAMVNIYISRDIFYIETENLASKISNKARHHTGLENIEKRLKYAYGDETMFSYLTDDHNIFKVKIIIPVRKMEPRAGYEASLPNNDIESLHASSGLK